LTSGFLGVFIVPSWIFHFYRVATLTEFIFINSATLPTLAVPVPSPDKEEAMRMILVIAVSLNCNYHTNYAFHMMSVYVTYHHQHHHFLNQPFGGDG